MNRARWIFKFLLERNARMFQPTLIDEINGAVRPKAPGHGRNGVNDQPHTLFDSIRCSFGITVVRFISTPPHDASSRAPSFLRADEHIGLLGQLRD
jgi:hypothetical protein